MASSQQEHAESPAHPHCVGVDGLPSPSPTTSQSTETPPSPTTTPSPTLLPVLQTPAEDHEAAISVLAQPSTTQSDHESDASDDHSTPHLHKVALDDEDDDEDDDEQILSDSSCVVCFERPTNITLDPCGHSNLCDVCVSRLVKRRCPTCRARARKVTIRRSGHGAVTKAVREVIQERKQRETRVLEDTLQIVFLGPEKVGKKTLVRKLVSKFPLSGCDNPATPPFQLDVFSDGTDFSANATIAGVNVRLTVLRRTTLTSRRMVLDDVRVLKPDVLVLCCSAHVEATFDTILSWDKVLRNNFQKPRVWALLELDDTDATAAVANPPTIEGVLDVANAIESIFPPDLRPKGHYFCSPGEHFSIGFRSLAKDMVAMGRTARDEELAASIALEEARSLADHEAAGTLGDQVAANLVIANNGITVPSASASGGAQNRGVSNGRGSNHVGRPFFLRGLRERSGNGQGISLSGLVSWLAGSHES